MQRLHSLENSCLPVGDLYILRFVRKPVMPGTACAWCLAVMWPVVATRFVSLVTYNSHVRIYALLNLSCPPKHSPPVFAAWILNRVYPSPVRKACLPRRSRPSIQKLTLLAFELSLHLQESLPVSTRFERSSKLLTSVTPLREGLAPIFLHLQGLRPGHFPRCHFPPKCFVWTRRTTTPLNLSTSRIRSFALDLFRAWIRPLISELTLFLMK